MRILSNIILTFGTLHVKNVLVMLDFVPVSMTVLFVSITLLTLGMFYSVLVNASSKRIRKNKSKIIIGLSVWLLIQLFLTLFNVYNANTDIVPPLIMVFGVLPTLIFILWLFSSKIGKRFMKNLPLKQLTLLNIIRIPVEISLYFLFEHKALPEIMTFDGWNFDILAGFSAPIIVLIAFRRGKIKRNLLLIWNIVSLLLLLNIIILAVLSAPSPFQQFGLEQPNVAVLTFPYSWLPTFIVPIVLFGHLVSIWKLTILKNQRVK